MMRIFQGIFGLGLILAGVGLWYANDNYSLYHSFGGETNKWLAVFFVGMTLSMTMKCFLSDLKFESWQSYSECGWPKRVIVEKTILSAVSTGVIVVLFFYLK